MSDASLSRSVSRGPLPDPATVDWEKAYRALVEACTTVPIKRHDRTPEQQAAVERFTTRLVQAGELLAGPELGMMNLPLEDGCSAREFLL